MRPRVQQIRQRFEPYIKRATQRLQDRMPIDTTSAEGLMRAQEHYGVYDPTIE